MVRQLEGSHSSAHSYDVHRAAIKTLMVLFTCNIVLTTGEKPEIEALWARQQQDFSFSYTIQNIYKIKVGKP